MRESVGRLLDSHNNNNNEQETRGRIDLRFCQLLRQVQEFFFTAGGGEGKVFGGNGRIK